MKPCLFTGIKDIPPYLYKYVSAKRALEIVLTQKIYFAHCKEFNDPRDGTFYGGDGIIEAVLVAANFDKDLAKSLKDTLKDYQDKLDDTNLGFFSMSEIYDSYPMWAHYADQHRGCCLRFNFSSLQSDYNWEDCFPFVFVEKMGYPKEDEKLPMIDAKESIPHEEDSVYMTKHSSWNYEQEWRAVMYYKGEYKPFGDVLFDSKCSFFKNMQGKGLYTLQEKFLDGIIPGQKMEESTREAITVAATTCGVKIIEMGIEE